MKTIGKVTRYVGTEHGYMKGRKVRIVAVLRHRAGPESERLVLDEQGLISMGPVRADDRIEVRPWNEERGQYSYVTSDALATDLECFEGLREVLP